MQQLPPLRSWYREGHAVVLDYGSERLRLSSVYPGTLRVLLQRHPYQRGNRVLRPPESVLPLPEQPLRAGGRRRGPVTVRCGALTLIAGGPDAPLRLADGTALTPAWDGFRVSLTGSLAPGERIYGMGSPEQSDAHRGLDRRGDAYDLFNAHQPRPSRLVLPVFYSSRGYGVLIDNSWVGRIDLGAADPDHWQYTATGGDLDFYLLSGPLPQMVEQLTALTGRPALPPRWTLGLLQSRFGYRSRAELEALAAEFRRREIPCDGLILDLYWYREMGDLCFDESAFPEPATMLRDLRQQGFKVMVIEQPFMSAHSRLFAEGQAQGYFARFPDGRTTFPFWFRDGEAALVDFTNPAAREWWIRQHQRLLAQGIAGWWCDLNEPEQHYPELLHQGGPAAQVHNRFALQMIATVAAAQARYAPGQRCFILSRSGWLGMAQYGASTWSGDVTSSFQALAQQPALGLGMGLAGVPGWNTDVGGFTGGTPTPELYVRWLQFAAFCPIARPHADHQAREPWAFGPAAEAVAAQYLRLRQQLIPYAYTALRAAHERGVPLLRPLVWAYPDDPTVADMADEYFYGPDLLVAPVLAEGVQERPVYLPAGDWYDFWSGERLAGGRWLTAAAPLERLPLYVRAGAVIPLAPLRPYESAQPPAELTLRIWPGEAESRFELYEDDGETEAYRQGAYALTGIRVGPGAGSIRIGRPRGLYAPRIPPRRWQLTVVQPAPPAAVLAGGRTLSAAASAEALAAMDAGWYYDAGGRTLHVRLRPARGPLHVEIVGADPVSSWSDGS